MNKPHYKRWILSICLAILITVAIAFNWYWLRAHYSNITRNHFKPGQKVYAIPQIFDANSKFTSIGILRMIRPINELDIDLMNISDAQKKNLIKNIDPSLKPYVIFNNMMFSSTDLKKAKTSCIGYYIDHEIYNVMGAKGDLIKGSFCEVKPIFNLLYDQSYNFKMPANYTWANSKYYLLTESITDEELPSFVK